MTQGNAMRSTLEFLLELSEKGHPLLMRLLSVELLMVPSATKTITKESIVRSRDRFLERLFKHLDPAVPEAFTEI